MNVREGGELTSVRNSMACCEEGDNRHSEDEAATGHVDESEEARFLRFRSAEKKKRRKRGQRRRMRIKKGGWKFNFGEFLINFFF